MRVTFWDRFLDELERALDQPTPANELKGLLRQGRWWSEFAHHDYAPEPRGFDLAEWAEQLRQGYSFEVHLADDLLVSRLGQPEAMELLVRALGCQTLGERPPPLRLEGDAAQVTVSAPWVVAAAGPLVMEVGRLLGAEMDQSGLLFRCPCPVNTGLSRPPIDLKTLSLTTLGDTLFERELVDTFLAEGHRQMASLAVNYAASTLHSLKGSAAMVGALRLAQLLEEQEHALDASRLPVLETEFGKVVDWLHRRQETLS